MHVIDASPKTVESFYDINEMSFHFMKGEGQFLSTILGLQVHWNVNSH